MVDRKLPSLFEERLRSILPQERLADVLLSFTLLRPWTVRINTLKMERASLLKILEERGIGFSEVAWCSEALIFGGIPAVDDLIQQGLIYRQNLSSLLPVLILDPRPGENVLDMCAAPGSKTTQMSALMKNQGSIVALESVRDRFYKLKSVVELLGAKNVSLKWTDARRFRLSTGAEGFDKILVDAPCSTEGRFSCHDAKSFGYWSLRKIKEMVHKQKGLLLHATRLLKPGGTLVYSTCTFAPEENEGVVDWVLRKTEGQLQVVASEIADVKTYPTLMSWEGKDFDSQVKNAVRVLPDETMEGFFVAKFVKEGF
ncbi:MAG: RsmB/NOP family class I SAM-dependent RNA methyltransferase [Candidatus Omnitrophica bacterium]|nr:RsmB/NOP family class I SAM-dependent RNA methyltransferase [Candidatus Omnitrophota bacterium]